MSKELADRMERGGRTFDGGMFLSAELLAQVIAALRSEPVAWMDGFPSKPWSNEWFIAETTYGDRVVLIALPEEYAYDFKTADDTYIKADKIKRWMQFPDSEYLAPSLESRTDRAEPVAEQLSAEEIEAKFEAWLRANCFQQPTQEAYELAKCAWKEMALSSLLGTEQCVVHPVMSCVCSQGTKSCTVNHGTFADGIEAVLSDAELHLSERQRSRIRALAQGQRSPKQGMPAELSQTQVADSDHPTEQDADELLREALDAYDHIVVKTGYQGDFDTSAGRAHLARKEPKCATT